MTRGIRVSRIKKKTQKIKKKTHIQATSLIRSVCFNLGASYQKSKHIWPFYPKRVDYMSSDHFTLPHLGCDLWKSMVKVNFWPDINVLSLLLKIWFVASDIKDRNCSLGKMTINHKHHRQSNDMQLHTHTLLLHFVGSRFAWCLLESKLKLLSYFRWRSLTQLLAHMSAAYVRLSVFPQWSQLMESFVFQTVKYPTLVYWWSVVDSPEVMVTIYPFTSQFISDDKHKKKPWEANLSWNFFNIL